MTLFIYRIHFSQEQREFVAQDESRLIGHRRVYVDLNVVAPTRELADIEAQARYAYVSSRPDVQIMAVTEVPIHALVTVHVMNHYTAHGGLKGPEAKLVQ